MSAEPEQIGLLDDHDDGTHQCPAKGCTARLPRNLLACSGHWYSVSAATRRLVNRLWRDDPFSMEYLRAREQAVGEMNQAIDREEALNHPPSAQASPSPSRHYADHGEAHYASRTARGCEDNGEPHFLLRAQDRHFRVVLDFYANLLVDPEMAREVRRIARAGAAWPVKKEPDL